MQKTLDIQACLGKKADEVITEKSTNLINTLRPNIEKARSLIDRLSVNIENKTMGINSALIQINDKLIRIHVGKAIVDYVVIGIVCLTIGLFGTLRITQKYHSKLLERSYKAKLELAQKQGAEEFRNELVKNNSGIIKILELEKEYVQKHRKTYEDPDSYIQSINEDIKRNKESKWRKDEE